LEETILKMGDSVIPVVVAIQVEQITTIKTYKKRLSPIQETAFFYDSLGKEFKNL
jgi:hypothetical protein